MAANAVVGVILARTLSVADFGIFSYALSLVVIGMAVMTAGLSGLAIKAFVDEPATQARTFSGLVLIREGFALTAYLALVGVSLTSGSADASAVTAVATVVLFARAFDATELWFQSQLLARRIAAVRITVVVLMLVIRVIAAVLGAGLWVFVLLYVVESFAVSASLLVRYVRAPGGPGIAPPSVAAARSLLSRSRLLLLSSIAAQINLRADQVILQSLLGSAAVGTYAAAARLSELAYALPVVFLTATFPVLLQVRREHGASSRQYSVTLQRSYDQACWAGIGLMVVLFAFGPWALELLFGEAYSSAGAVLRIHVLALPFIFMAAVLSKWIIAENLLWASLVRHGLGAALNIGLNFLLIPQMGIRGAAVATVVSYAAGSYLACFLGKSTYPAAIKMTLAFLAPVRLGMDAARRAGAPK